MAKRGMTERQRERQNHRDRAGRYATSPCYRCGRSAGVNYLSDRRTDSTDSNGNRWGGRALCLCAPCAEHLDLLDDTAAWAEIIGGAWGKLARSGGEDG